MLPLLALPCGYGLARFPRLGTALAALSVGITTLATWINACVPDYWPIPFTQCHLPLLVQGNLSSNLGIVVGLSRYVSVAVYDALLIGGVVWLWRQCREADGA